MPHLIIKVNNTLTNDIVIFEQLGPDLYCDSLSRKQMPRSVCTSAQVDQDICYCAFNIFQKVVFCLALYTKGVNLQILSMI